MLLNLFKLKRQLTLTTMHNSNNSEGALAPFSHCVFDIETDGFLDVLTKIHCLVVQCARTGELRSFADKPGYEPINVGLTLLYQAEMVIGHNILCFDLPAITKVYPDWRYQGEVYDTLTMSRVIYANMISVDFKFKFKGMPMSMYGRHSLASWGYRLGDWKGDYSGGWDKWSKDMQDYCEQDVRVNTKIYKKLLEKNYDPRCTELEHEFQKYIISQEYHGVPFDVEKAEAMANEIGPAKEALKNKIRETIPFLVKEEEFIPKRDNKTMGYKKGVPFIKRKEIPFNPGSRTQIVKLLKSKYGWNPTDFTDKGNPTVKREVLEKLTDWEEVPYLIDYLDMHKLSGQLYSGQYAWLKLQKEGRIHGGVITNGAVTGRCTHNRPNLAQVPSLRSYKGEECRSLFYAPKGYKMVGADASGLELRMLAHYLTPFDGGRYGRIIIEEDVHTANQQAAGLESRDDAKTFIYAYLYGAGDAKLGSIVEPKSSESRQRTIGADLRRKFLTKTEGLGKLVARVNNAYKTRRHLIGLDGRLLHPRSAHKALNTLLQGGGAVVMKQATVLAAQELRADGLIWQPALHIHDEIQILTKEDNAEMAGQILVDGIVKAGTTLNLQCPLDGEYKIGDSWAETH